MNKIFILLFLFVTPTVAMAQGPVCSEPKIREAVQKGTYYGTADAFFWSGAYDKPLIGSAEGEEAYKKLQIEAPRKNQVISQHPQRIVASESGDMAYEYGAGEMSFDDLKTGKHLSFQNAYLRVWKSMDGDCRVAATMIRPIDSTMKETVIQANPKGDSPRPKERR